jgi:4-hydroxybenzoate polyprenyltransferase
MNIYRRFDFVSFDIVLGALASTSLAACLFNAHPGWAWWVTLGCTVWLLYMGDHVVDAWKQRKTSKRELHRYISTHRRILIYSMGIVSIVDLILIFNFLQNSLLKYALALGGLVFLFYAMRHLFRKNRVLFIPGEAFVLLLYMAGTWLGPFVTRETLLETPHALITIMFAGVLLMNLGVISLYDINLDSRLGITSLAQTLGKKTTRNLLVATGIAIYLLLMLQFLIFGLDRYSQFALILSGMATIQFLVLFLPSFFRKKEYFRWTADAALFMGFLALLIR